MDSSLVLYFLIVSCVLQFFVLSSAIMWTFRFRRDLDMAHVKIWELNNELVNHAVALCDSGMLPHPWEEIEKDLESPETNNTIRVGNVYYLNEED